MESPLKTNSAGPPMKTNSAEPSVNPDPSLKNKSQDDLLTLYMIAQGLEKTLCDRKTLVGDLPGQVTHKANQKVKQMFQTVLRKGYKYLLKGSTFDWLDLDTDSISSPSSSTFSKRMEIWISTMYGEDLMP